MAQNEEGVDKDTSSSLITGIIADIIYSPLNLGLFVVCLYLLYKIFANRKTDFQETPPTPQLPPLKRHDMTYEELKKYDGHNEDGRVCVAVNGKVFDVTKGKRHYGPGNSIYCYSYIFFVYHTSILRCLFTLHEIFLIIRQFMILTI